MKLIENVLCEKGGPCSSGTRVDINNLRLPEKAVPVYINFDYRNPMGNAEVRLDDGKVLANVMLKDEFPEGPFWPAVGMNVDLGTCNPIGWSGDLYCISLNTSENLDAEIPYINIP